MENKEKQIEKMADILCESKEHNCNGEDCKCLKQATDLYNANCRILDEDFIAIPEIDYRYLKDMADRFDPFWFCAFGGCEGACKECKDTCEMSIFVKERKKFYDKFNENICGFTLENKSEEYKDGYIQAIADICDRLDKTAVELGVNIKE